SWPSAGGTPGLFAASWPSAGGTPGLFAASWPSAGGTPGLFAASWPSAGGTPGLFAASWPSAGGTPGLFAASWPSAGGTPGLLLPVPPPGLPPPARPRLFVAVWYPPLAGGVLSGFRPHTCLFRRFCLPLLFVFSLPAPPPPLNPWTLN
uniref:Uncharacterized protein n=1 Tax=Anabas testudineus TaxID=64144 RepID=A0A3Q1KB46_ANATE